MYTRPGVYIYQQYTDRIARETTVPQFPAGVLGPCYPVVEGARAYAGELIPGGDPHTAFFYPQRDEVFDVILTNSVRIFLVPSAATSFRVESITRKYLREQGITRDFVGPVAEVTTAVKNYTWIDSNNATRSGIESAAVYVPKTFNLQQVTTYNGFKFNSDGTPAYPSCHVYVEYIAYRAPTARLKQTFTEKGATTFELVFKPQNNSVTVKLDNGAGTVLDITQQCTIDYNAKTVTYANGIPASNTLIIEYTGLNPIYLNKLMINSVNDIEKYFGAPHPLNPVSLATYLALSQAGQSVYAKAVSTVATGSYDIDTSALASAISEFDNVYAIAVTDSVKRVLSVVKNFISTYSEPRKSMFKIAMLGFKGYNDASTNIGIQDKEKAKNDFVQFGYTVKDMRIRILANPIVTIDLFGTKMPVYGYYYGAIYAGQVERIMSANPAQPLTNTLAPVLDASFGIAFTEDDLDEIAAAGYWILSPEIDGVYVRHQLTTETSDYAKREDSVVRAVDSFSIIMRNSLKRIIGSNNLTPTFIKDTLTPILSEQIKRAITNGMAGQNTRIVNIEQTAPDSLKVSILYEPLIPVNVIEIVLVV